MIIRSLLARLLFLMATRASLSKHQLSYHDVQMTSPSALVLFMLAKAIICFVPPNPNETNSDRLIPPLRGVWLFQIRRKGKGREIEQTRL